MTPQQIQTFTAGLDGPALIESALDAAIWNRGDLARNSGLTPSRIKQLADGKRPTKAERAAINWAIALRLL